MPAGTWSAPNLKDKVAIVTGASRGAGRGIARVLGECGATVYVTGRSTRGGPTTADLGATVEETAEQVTARGGRGIPVRCDHTDDAQVRALFDRVRGDDGRLDLLVNNCWGGYEDYSPDFGARFWKQSFEKRWQGMFLAGFRAHLYASYLAAPLMLPHKNGLIVSTIAWMEGPYMGNFYYDLSKAAIVRLIFGLAHELRRHNIAAVALAPGFMRTELVLAAFKASEETWRKFPGLASSESVEYVGRAVASLASDPRVMEKTGRARMAGDLAGEYGFPDVDGRRVPAFRAHWEDCPACQGAGEKNGKECRRCMGYGQLPAHDESGAQPGSA